VKAFMSSSTRKVSIPCSVVMVVSSFSTHSIQRHKIHRRGTSSSSTTGKPYLPCIITAPRRRRSNPSRGGCVPSL
jgi:hypothetical protein